MIRHLSLILVVIILLITCSGCILGVDQEHGGYGDRERGGFEEHERGEHGERH
jgi:hypothetical protein